MAGGDDLLYLRDEVYFEPLFNQWYAWPYLIPPVTAARHTVNTHRRIMTSFVGNAQLHAVASRDPALTGGEFLNLSPDKVDDIGRLVDRIDTELAGIVELSNAIDALDALVNAHTSGESVEQLYAKLPAPLQGYVEITMDMYHNVSFRLLEALLYRSPHYRPELQTVSLGMLSKVGERPFVLSTPRLPDDDHVQIALDFRAPILDELFRARTQPITRSRLNEIASGLTLTGGLDFDALFTTDKPASRHQPPAEGVRLHYTGHAGFLLETANSAIMVDPIIASRDQTNAAEIIGFTDLPEYIDYVLITHNHQDHNNLETLLQLRHKIGAVVVPRNNGGSLADPSMKLLLQNLGFTVLDVEEFDEIPFKDGVITSIPFLGEHGDLSIRSKSAWFVSVLGQRIFFGADSSNLDPNMYRHIKEHVGDVDILAIGMECVGAPYTWIYGALYTRRVSRKIKESRRLNGSNFEQANAIAKIFQPKEVYLYALGMEPWYKYFMGLEYSENSEQILQTDKMLDECARSGIRAERLYGKRTLTFQ